MEARDLRHVEHDIVRRFPPNLNRGLVAKVDRLDGGGCLCRGNKRQGDHYSRIATADTHLVVVTQSGRAFDVAAI